MVFKLREFDRMPMKVRFTCRVLVVTAIGAGTAFCELPASEKTTTQCPGSISIPFFTRSRTYPDSADWSSSVKTKRAGMQLIAYWQQGKHLWAGFGQPLQASREPLDLGRFRGCFLNLKISGARLKEIRVKFNESKDNRESAIVYFRDYLNLKVSEEHAIQILSIPMIEFGGGKLDWREYESIVFDTYCGSCQAKLNLTYPLSIGPALNPPQLEKRPENHNLEMVLKGSEEQTEFRKNGPTNIPAKVEGTDEPVIQNREFLKKLLYRVIHDIDDKGRPHAETIWSRGDLRKGFSPYLTENQMKQPVTYSETVAYYLKILVLATETGLITPGDGQRLFKVVYGWSRDNLQIGNFSRVYDLDNRSEFIFAGKQKSSMPLPEDLARVHGKLKGCFAWRYIPEMGIPFSQCQFSLSSIQPATDGDLEIASSLLLAQNVFSEASIDYKNEARKIASCIKNNLITEFQLPGTDGKKLSILAGGFPHSQMNGIGAGGHVAINPSYFLFHDLDVLHETFRTENEFKDVFLNLKNSSFQLLDQSTETLAPDSGLPLDWARVSVDRAYGVRILPYNWVDRTQDPEVSYGYESVRIPIRLRIARLRGRNESSISKYYSKWMPKTTACLHKFTGIYPPSIDGNCQVIGDKIKSATSILAARVWFLEARDRKGAESSLKLLDERRLCNHEGKRRPGYACDGDDYYPVMLTLMMGLEDIRAEQKSQNFLFR